MTFKYLGSLFMLAWNRIVLFNSYELNAGNTYMVYLDSLVLMHGSNVKREQQESGMSQITPPPQIIYTQPERKFITFQNIPQRLSLKIRAVIRSIPRISPHFLLASEIWLTQNEASEIKKFIHKANTLLWGFSNLFNSPENLCTHNA